MDFATIEINDYGFCLDTAWTYIALSWQLIAITTALFIGYKIYKKRFAKI